MQKFSRGGGREGIFPRQGIISRISRIYQSFLVEFKRERLLACIGGSQRERRERWSRAESPACIRLMLSVITCHFNVSSLKFCIILFAFICREQARNALPSQKPIV